MDILNLMRLPQAIRNLQRSRQILGVVVRYGFGDLIIPLHLDTHVSWVKRLVSRKFRQRADEASTRFTTEERIRMAIEELGPTFIKFGQVLSTRADLIPMSLVIELRKLQDNVPPFPSQEAVQVIERELGAPLTTLFSSFEQNPLAAASIAQVHAAHLPSGEKVVIKVQRPNIQKVISIDLDILRILARLLEERIPESRPYNPTGIVEEFSRSISHEIDFTLEAYNILRFAENFRDCDFIRAPRVFKSHCSSRILTMELIDGIRGDDYAAMDRAGFARKLLAERGAQAVLQQVFIDGFFHADPHPGNIFVLPGNVICFIDYGMMGTVDDERIDELLIFLVSILTGDLDKMVNLFYRTELIDEQVNLRAMKSEVKALVDRYNNLPLGKINVAAFIQDIFEVIQRNRVTVPPDRFLMAKAIATMEGVAQDLYPAFDPLKNMRDFLLKIYLKRLTNPAHLAKKVYRNFDRIFSLVKRLPKDVGHIIGKLRRGEFAITLREERFAAQFLQKNRRTNRLVVAILILSLNIGSPILTMQQIGPLVRGWHLTTLLGMFGFGLSGFLTFLVILSILRSDMF